MTVSAQDRQPGESSLDPCPPSAVGQDGFCTLYSGVILTDRDWELLTVICADWLDSRRVRGRDDEAAHMARRVISAATSIDGSTP